MAFWKMGSGILAFALGMAALAQGEMSSYQDVLKEMLATMDQISATLTKIRDRDTAKEAEEPLRKLAGQWQTAYKKVEELPPPNKEEKDKLEKEFKNKLIYAQKKLFAEIARVKSVPGGKVALQEISTALTPKGK